MGFQMLGLQSYNCIKKVLCNYVLWSVYSSLFLDLQLIRKITKNENKKEVQIGPFLAFYWKLLRFFLVNFFQLLYLFKEHFILYLDVLKFSSIHSSFN
jgi:hypothetical protein